jgi:DUF4097 and DUF4098 domain-containing protein YvlB
MGRLEKFIKENRSQMDDLVPSEKLWVGVSAGIGKSLIIKSKLAWLKYFGFGASVVAVTVASYLYVSQNSDTKKTGHSNKPTNSNIAIADTVKPESPKDTLIASVVETPVALPAEKKAAAELILAKPEQVQREKIIQEKAEVRNVKSVAEAPVAEVQMVSAKKIQTSLDTIFTGIKLLTVNVACLNVNIDPAGIDKVRIYSSIQPLNGEFEIKGKKFVIEYDRTGSELKVTIRSKEKNINVECARDLNLYIEVPGNIDIALSTAFGDISAKKLSGSVCELKSTSGNIRAEDISSDLKVTSSFGDFIGKKLKGDINIRSASGNLALTDCEGKIDVSSAFGKTEFTNLKGKVKCTVSSGKTALKDCEGEFNLNNAYGDITFNHFHGFGNFTATSGNITGTEMNLTGDVKLVTNFGMINLKLNNAYSDLSFDTKTSFGVIHVDMDGQKIHADKQFKNSKGKIQITAVTQSGSQYYR